VDLVLRSLSAVSEAPASRQVVDRGSLEGRFRYSPKQGPPSWGGYVTLKLCQSSMAYY